MLDGMDAEHLEEWRLFFEAEPFGGPHTDQLWAQLLDLTYDAHRDHSRSRGRKLEDWCPSLRDEIPESPADARAAAREQVERGRAWASMLRDRKAAKERRSRRKAGKRREP